MHGPSCSRLTRVRHRSTPQGPRNKDAIELLNQLPRSQRKNIPAILRAPDRAERSPLNAHIAGLERTSPPSALVDEDHRVLHFSPQAGRFILPPSGPLATELPDLVRPELRAELRSALHRAFTGQESTITLAGQCPIRWRSSSRHHVCCCARDRAQHCAASLGAIHGWWGWHPDLEDADDLADGQGAVEIRRLREELRTAQERLSASRREHESSIQDLRIANEELQSVNEEYRSTAEELETSKEELQSINEELQTVNSELKSKLDNVANAHSDLQNLINATEIGTLFLDAELRIKMLTPAVETAVQRK